MTDLLSTYLADPDLVGTKNILVSFDLYANSARPGHTIKQVSILAPREVAQLAWSSHAYKMIIANGHVLNPDGLGNRIDVYQTKRALAPTWINVSFLMEPDGEPLASDDGQNYCVALRGTGETVLGSGPTDSGGVRLDLAFGDPPANRADYDAPGMPFHWIGSAVRNVDISLIDVPTLTSKPGARRSHFS